MYTELTDLPCQKRTAYSFITECVNKHISVPVIVRFLGYSWWSFCHVLSVQPQRNSHSRVTECNQRKFLIWVRRVMTTSSVLQACFSADILISTSRKPTGVLTGNLWCFQPIVALLRYSFFFKASYCFLYMQEYMDKKRKTKWIITATSCTLVGRREVHFSPSSYMISSYMCIWHNCIFCAGVLKHWAHRYRQWNSVRYIKINEEAQ